jgi:hypothetical protein
MFVPDATVNAASPDVVVVVVDGSVSFPVGDSQTSLAIVEPYLLSAAVMTSGEMEAFLPHILTVNMLVRVENAPVGSTGTRH